MHKRFPEFEMPNLGQLDDKRRSSSRVKIKDVAREAGVSVATASKALNNRGRMTTETRQRVQDAAKRLGFTPNALARALVSQRSFTIGLLTDDTYGRFTLPVATGLSSALADHGVSVFLSTFEEDPQSAMTTLRAMQDKLVDGLVIAGKRIDHGLPISLPPISMPIVHVNSLTREHEIGFLPDDRGGARNAVAHLTALGRCRIMHISGPLDFEAVRLRAMGWEDALHEAGLPIPQPPIFGEWSEAFGFQEANRILLQDKSRRPDAIFCGNDQIARGVIDALTLGGVKVPDDIAIVGFDNWEVLSTATRPPLTTVDMGLSELGRQAGLTLLRLIDGETIPAGIRHLPCQLVIRQSCGSAQEVVGYDGIQETRGITADALR